MYKYWDPQSPYNCFHNTLIKNDKGKLENNTAFILPCLRNQQNNYNTIIQTVTLILFKKGTKPLSVYSGTRRPLIPSFTHRSHKIIVAYMICSYQPQILLLYFLNLFVLLSVHDMQVSAGFC